MAENRRPGRMGGMHGPMRAGEKPKHFRKTLGRMLSYMGRYRIAVFVVMIFAVGSTIFHVIGPKILGNATTELFNGLIAKISGTGSIDYGKIGSIIER